MEFPSAQPPVPAESPAGNGNYAQEPSDSAGQIALGGLHARVLAMRAGLHDRLAARSTQDLDHMTKLHEMVSDGSSRLTPDPVQARGGRERRAQVKQSLRRESIARASLRADIDRDIFGTTNLNGEMTVVTEEVPESALGYKLNERGEFVPTGTKRVPVYEEFDGSTTETQRNANFAWITKGGETVPDDMVYGYTTTRQATVPSDVGTPQQETRLRSGIYSPKHIKAERQSAKDLRDAEFEIAVQRDNMDAALQGETRRGRRLRQRAQKHGQKAAGLRARLQGRTR